MTTAGKRHSGALAALFMAAVLAGPAGAETARTLPRGALPDTISGRQGTYFYYHGLDHGSGSLIHPARLILNGGFGIMQIENRDNRPGKVMYGRGLRNVSENLVRPWRAIEVNGWWDFFSREVIPISVNSGQAQYWPNYMNHLIGGGMSYRMMEEYYRYHGRRHSKLLAGGTIFIYHLLNEVVENDARLGPNVDPIADFWIFNPAGVWLFSKDSVARFFSEKLHLGDWSYQPVFQYSDGEFQNNGQNYVMKYHLDAEGRRSIFYHWGTHAELGLSFTDEQGRCLSFGLGLIAKNLLDIDEITKTVDLAVSGGIFYDRNNSLLASLQFARTKDYAYRLNLYPGLVRLGPLRPGLFAALDQDNQLFGGITLGSLHHLPLGIGWDF